MATKKPSVIAKLVPELLLVSGIFLVVISTTHRFLRDRSLRMDEITVSQYLSQSLSTKELNYPTHITIPWYIDVDIDPQVYSEGSWTVSVDSASYLTASALPGSPGNIIIYGHNKRSILGNIRALKGSETITLTLADGTARLYLVRSVAEVPPTHTQLLAPTTEETLTLYTCSGLFDSQRFVVRATPVLDQDASL